MLDRGLGHLFHDLLGRVERSSCGLRHIGHFTAAQAAHIAQRGFQDITPVDPDLSTGNLHTAAAIGHGGKADGGFAGAGFPDETEYLALFQIKADAMHDFDVMRPFAGRIDRCPDFQVTDFNQWIAHPRPPFSEVVRFSTQSATRLTEIASVAMAKAGISAAGMP